MNDNWMDDLDLDMDDDEEFSVTRPTIDDVQDSMIEFDCKVWYSQPLDQRDRIEAGLEAMPEDWAEQVENADEIEAVFAGELGPWNDFERGMLYGKVSTLEWVLGQDNWLTGEPHIELRSEAEIVARLDVVFNHVWYNRHQNLLYRLLLRSQKRPPKLLSVCERNTAKIGSAPGQTTNGMS